MHTAIPHPDKELTGRQIKRVVERSGYSVHSLAEAMCLSPESIYHWFSGKCFPNIDNLCELSRLLHVPFEALVVCTCPVEECRNPCTFSSPADCPERDKKDVAHIKNHTVTNMK